MKILSTPDQLQRAINRLLKRCVRARWAVAWASSSAPSFALLCEQREKLEQLTVGTHFYQTDPEFIAEFLEDEHAQFVMQPSGVFHPKVYYFEHQDGTWDCVVGSPNFTRGAFSQNQEMAVWFDHRAGAEVRKELLMALDGYRELASPIDADGLKKYRLMWARQQKRITRLAGTYTTKPRRRSASPLDQPLFRETWEEFYATIREESDEVLRERLAVLETAREGFLATPHFGEIDPELRNGIAGIIETPDMTWGWFGRMSVNGLFVRAIKEGNPQISEAIDHIPLTGDVGRGNFDAFAETFLPSFGRSGLGTGTRLLAVKRPDLFVCLDSKNRTRLCEEFDIPKNIRLENYWDAVVMRIRDSNWWDSPEPTDDFERRIWQCRVAFLDVRFYDPE